MSRWRRPQLIGEEAAREMLDGIPDSVEVVLERTGHMFRFSHPKIYAAAIEKFLCERVDLTGHPNAEVLSG